MKLEFNIGDVVVVTNVMSKFNEEHIGKEAVVHDFMPTGNYQYQVRIGNQLLWADVTHATKLAKLLLNVN